MKHLLPAAALSLAVSLTAAAQNQEKPLSPEEEEKQLYEYIDKEVERLTNLLDLEYWQSFYVDSVLNANLKGMKEEVKSMSAAKYSGVDSYQSVSDKWVEKTFNAFRSFLTDQQWAKYLKSGAGREKKARDKRLAKKERALQETTGKKKRK